MFKPGQGPRISPGRRGWKGWSLSLTSFVPLNLSGPGGGSTLRISRVGMIAASSNSERPASDPYEGKAVAIEASARAADTKGRIMFLATAVNRSRHSS